MCFHVFWYMGRLHHWTRARVAALQTALSPERSIHVPTTCGVNVWNCVKSLCWRSRTISMGDMPIPTQTAASAIVAHNKGFCQLMRTARVSSCFHLCPSCALTSLRISWYGRDTSARSIIGKEGAMSDGSFVVAFFIVFSWARWFCFHSLFPSCRQISHSTASTWTLWASRSRFSSSQEKGTHATWRCSSRVVVGKYLNKPTDLFSSQTLRFKVTLSELVDVGAEGRGVMLAMLVMLVLGWDMMVDTMKIWH